MKLQLLRIAIIVLLSFIPLLFIWSTANIPNRNRNGFERTFIQNYISFQMGFDLPKNSNSLIGEFDNDLFVSTNTLNTFYKVDPSLNGYETMHLPFKLTISANAYSIFLKKDSLLLFKNSHLQHFRYHLPSKQMVESTLYLPSFIYSFIDKDSLILIQEYSPQSDEKQFSLYNRYNGELITLGISNNRLHALNMSISTDGQILYDDKLNVFVYMHYYQNKFLTINTSSGRVDRYQTIDTITNSLLTMKNQSLLVINQKGAVHSGYLYLSSNLKADNESYRDYHKHIPIDIYDIENGKYKGSISLPLYKKSLIKSMIFLSQSRLAILYHNNRLSIFSINCI